MKLVFRKMKKKELLSLRTKTKEELARNLKDKKIEMMKTFANMKGQREKDLKKAKSLRQTIAQISTIIREKELVPRRNDEG